VVGSDDREVGILSWAMGQRPRLIDVFCAGLLGEGTEMSSHSLT
jgi:hypothetical protein